MSALIPLKEAPKYLTKMQSALSAMNEAFASGISVSEFLDKLSIKGGKFSIPIDGEKSIIRNGTGKKAKPVTEITVVVMAGRDGMSKAYYDEEYDPDDPAAPVCVSSGGVVPGKESSDKQSLGCSQCPHNQWGSGTGKGKACHDSKELVVALLEDDELVRDDENNIRVFNLSVPPMSLKNWKKYTKRLTELNAPVPAVVTEIGQVGEDSFPVVDFEESAYVPEDVLGEILERVGESDVQDFLEIEDSTAKSDDDIPTPKAKKEKNPKPLKKKAALVEKVGDSDGGETIVEDEDLDFAWEDDE